MTQPIRLKVNHPSKIQKEMNEKPPAINLKCLFMEMFIKCFYKCIPCVSGRRHRDEKVPLAPRTEDE